MDFGKWAFDNKKLVSFLIFVLIIGGLYSYWALPKLEDPEIRVRQAMVVGIYPGASAHEVELELVDPLEKSIRQMPNVHSVLSQASCDMCLMTVELESTVPDEQLEQHWDILRRKVQAASLPSGVSQVMVRDDFGDVFGMFYALTGDGLTDKQLSDYAEYIKRELILIDGVNRVDIYGKRAENIRVTLRQDKMAHLGVSPIEVIQTLNAQCEAVYGGYFLSGSDRVRVTIGDRSTTVEDIAQLIVQGHEQDQIRLSDLADVYMAYETPVRNSMTYDGQNALGICISASSGVDITKVGKVVDETIARLETSMPVGVNCQKVFFQPERVDSALNTFLVNLIESVLLVVLVLMFCMGFRSGVIIGYSLIVIVLGSILVLNALDGTLQRVSLASFILAMGMLVDNAIVIVDGILVDKKKGYPKQMALTSIGRKTSMPLLGATMIAILAFLPIFMSPDTTGTYVRDLFIVMAVSLLLSWILALVHVPLMASRLLYGKADDRAQLTHRQIAERRARYAERSLRRWHWLHVFRTRNSHGQNNPHETIDDYETQQEQQQAADMEYKSGIYRKMRGLLEFLIDHRWLSVTVAVGLFVVSALCYKLLPQGFFPDMEYDQLYMEYKLPEGTNYTRVTQDLEQIQQYLRTCPEVKHITASTGGTPTRYNLVRSIATPSLAYGELIIDFESPHALVKCVSTLQDSVQAMFPDAYVKFKRYNLMYKKYPIEAQFTGPDPAVLHQLADSCRALMMRSGAVNCITTDWDPKVTMLEVAYNQSNARRMGLSRKEVGTSLLAATDGIPVGVFYDGIHAVKVSVDCVDKDGGRIEMLEDASVFGLMPNFGALLEENNLLNLASGNIDRSKLVSDVLATSPLRQVSDGVSVRWEDPVVMRYNGQRQQRVQCSPAEGYSAASAKELLDRMIAEQMTLPEGYKLEWQGEAAASKSSMKYLFNNYPLSILLMIAILIMLFKDYKVPALIFCCIPLILVGVIPAVLLSGKAFGFVAIVGVLGLVGMMIKNGIVLMDEINLQISEGRQPREALIRSSLSRLRPVSMASVTTVLGMIPLLPDAMFGSLAVTIMGGLIAGTVIVLLFIPVLYALFYKIK